MYSFVSTSLSCLVSFTKGLKFANPSLGIVSVYEGTLNGALVRAPFPIEGFWRYDLDSLIVNSARSQPPLLLEKHDLPTRHNITNTFYPDVFAFKITKDEGKVEQRIAFVRPGNGNAPCEFVVMGEESSGFVPKTAGTFAVPQGILDDEVCAYFLHVLGLQAYTPNRGTVGASASRITNYLKDVARAL